MSDGFFNEINELLSWEKIETSGKRIRLQKCRNKLSCRVRCERRHTSLRSGPERQACRVVTQQRSVRRALHASELVLINYYLACFGSKAGQGASALFASFTRSDTVSWRQSSLGSSRARLLAICPEKQVA